VRGTCPWSNFNETEKTLGCFSNEKRFEKATANLSRTQALQRELLKVAGWPDCRAAYQENLREAEEWEEYCQELVDHPDRGHSGTGSDPASRRRKLGETKAAVADRRRLLAELDETAEA
jgi:hypothetical protein